ncbi:hypothetical protein [Methanoregula sp.]|jgi:hypothetical protein|uniref:hypothetical protein n=1 Tax=Methanoregula sp. TaxID=2052170 RepID=UPI0025CD4C8E|nr:hypothetical protein [Methanoregula sp.]
MKWQLILIALLIGFVLMAGCSSSQSGNDILTPTNTPLITSHPTTQITRLAPQNTVASPRPTMIIKTTKLTTPAIQEPTQEPTEELTIPTTEITTTSVSASSVSGTCTCTSDAYNCKDFTSHAEAQACYAYCKSMGMGDIHKLDANDDGNPCESLK